MSRTALIVGGSGLTQVGESLVKAGAPGWDLRLIDTAAASSVPRLIRLAAWRLGRRPPRLRAFSRSVVTAAQACSADVVVTTGAAPVVATDLASLGRFGVRRINVSTDDPWNPTMRAEWFLKALPHYDAVFTPRHSNTAQLAALGIDCVQWLPFGYDPAFCTGPEPDLAEAARLSSDVLFVGGADAVRAVLVEALVAAGLHVALYGGYWNRFVPAGADWRGHAEPEVLRRATRAARASLVVPRHANRDGHTMRSVEAGATGTPLLAEDTPDHRLLYGDDGAIFFETPEELVRAARTLVSDASERDRLTLAVRERVRSGRHTYADRLETVLNG